LETDRENAAGAYFGRLAECPNPYVTTTDPPSFNIRVVPKRQKRQIQLMETADIGEIVENTLHETGPVMRVFWERAVKAYNPEEEFKVAWAYVADEFAKSAARQAAVRFRSAAHRRWHHISAVVHSVLLEYETGVMAAKLLLRHHPHELAQRIVDAADAVADALILTADGITVGGERAEHWIRSGFVEAKMLPRSRDALLDSARFAPRAA